MPLLSFTVLLVLLLTTSPARAQSDSPLVGPLLGATDAQQSAILLHDLATGTTRRLHFGQRWHMLWGFSADGCRIIYTLSENGARGRAYSARLDGSDARELVQFNELPADQWEVWEAQPSPDGARIAFTLIRIKILADGTSQRSYHIAWVGAEGGAPEFYSITGDEHEPEWSPDGQWLAYISYTRRVPGADIYSTAAPTPEGQPVNIAAMLREADLWVVSADGQVKYNLANFPTGSLRAPRWSPDGSLIAFTYSPSPGNDQFWMIANAQGAIPTQLSQQWSLILDTTWLPDSSAIIGAARDFRAVAENVLWQIPLVGSADANATRYLADPALSYADYPRFSPDGRYLALRSSYALALVDLANNGWRLLDELGLGNMPPVWSPAGFAGEAACSQN